MDMINATGRRKSAVARVFLTEGTGKITINKRDLTEYFPSPILQYVVKQPLQLLGATEKYDIKVNIDGGGFTGQSQALRLAIARALVKINAAQKASSLATLALLNVKNRDAPKHAVASNSANVNIRFALPNILLKSSFAKQNIWFAIGARLASKLLGCVSPTQELVA